MRMYKIILKGVLIFMIVVVLVGQENRINIEEFLQNIRRWLEKTIKSQPRSNRRSRNKKEKEKVRKRLTNKLSTPRFLFPHSIKIYEKAHTLDKKGENRRDNTISEESAENISPQIINNVLKSNPHFNPFRIDRLKKLLKKVQESPGKLNNNAQSSSGEGRTSDIGPQLLKYQGNLVLWLDEIYSNIDWFWNTVYVFFILDYQRFEYLKNVLCKEEIKDSSVWTYHKSSVQECGDDRDDLPFRFKLIRLENAAYMTCYPLEPQKLKVYTRKLGEVLTCDENRYVSDSIYGVGLCTPLIYAKARLQGYMNQTKVNGARRISSFYNAQKSLCYNLAALNYFAYKSNLNQNYSSDYISSKISRFMLYVQFMAKIYKEKVIPALVDMCYVRRLCKDIGIGHKEEKKDEKKEEKRRPLQRPLSQEEIIIFIAWNLIKTEVITFIDSLSHFEDGINSINSECKEIKNKFKNIVKLWDIENKLFELQELKNKIVEIESDGEIGISYYKKLLKLAAEVKNKLFPWKEALIELWKAEVEKIESVKDFNCVVMSFNKFINAININGKNALELNLRNIIDKERLIKQIIKVLENELDNISTIDKLFEMKNSFSKVLREFSDSLNDSSYNFFNVLKKGAELTSSVKIKALMKIAALTSYESFVDARSDTIGSLVNWVYILDYQIYFFTEVFNSVKCIMNSVSGKEFVEFVGEKMGWFTGILSSFMDCFIIKRKEIEECDTRYRIIKPIIGEDITLENVGNLKEKLDSLTKYEKWSDVPAIKGCCEGICKNVGSGEMEFCRVANSSDFKKCCFPPLDCCKPNSTTFCLECSGNQTVANINCIDYYGSIAAPSNSKCLALGSKMGSVLTKPYWKNGALRIILCDMIEKYRNFCFDTLNTLRGITDDDNNYVVELKCECAGCDYLGINIDAICKEQVKIDYNDRTAIEKYLKGVELFEDARNVISRGFTSIGVCSFSR
ncbi:MAG: hypothetical protein QXU40_03805 [Candidatus Pacearchaeota archaeon]